MVKQAEDEIAVANMTIGAGHAGARAMCATSGGGFALMTEAIGMAGMIEAPAVFVLVMRGGPSTGLPTKTEQADLNQAFGASQGDYPRVILAPADVHDCFRTMEEAFNLADAWQLPVIVVSDLLLGGAQRDGRSRAVRLPLPDRSRAGGDRAAARRSVPPLPDHRWTASRRARCPGTPGTVFHGGDRRARREGPPDLRRVDPSAHPPPDGGQAGAQGARRCCASCPPPTVEGPPDAPLTLVGWGSTKGVIREARGLLEARGT